MILAIGRSVCIAGAPIAATVAVILSVTGEEPMDAFWGYVAIVLVVGYVSTTLAFHHLPTRAQEDR